MQHYLYLSVNLGCFLVPFLFSFHPKLMFIRHLRSALLGIAAMMLVFIPWDIYFTAQGIWGFNDQYTIGKKIGGLPIEEWLFFICIPYACLFTYHCFQVLIHEVKFQNFYRYLAILAGVLFIIIACMHIQQAYTFTAHLLSGIFLLLHVFIFKQKYLVRFMQMFVVILIPFISSNGILTGISFWKYPLINIHPENITDQIVWYNNAENLGIRIFSMPLDDVAYGLLMLLLATTVYEYFKKKSVASV